MIAVVAIVVALAPSGAAARRNHNCAVRGRTVVANRVARVFRAHYDPNDDSETYACLYRGGGAKLLTYDLAGSGTDVFHGAEFQLAGTFVASAQVECGGGECDYSSVRSVDLRTRRTARSPDRMQPDLLAPFALRLAKSGSFAVAARERYPSVYGVFAVEARGKRTLDSGVDVDPNSLALAGSRVYWMRGGVPRSATIH
ncbi:MAG: hypothetical protein QOD53_676 [Thermoleophilaceae bacterium]|nr:hypothetical protein [Thermoleophilaceae bacterium]